MPTFLFFKEGDSIGKVTGADVNKLKVSPSYPIAIPTTTDTVCLGGHHCSLRLNFVNTLIVEI